MKVSVSIVTYNHENFIGPCLDSILSQQVNFDYEIVVGEDCSTDATRKVLLGYHSKHPKKIKLLLHKTNLGVHKNFQAVLDSCTGEYIAHLDGDDLMLPGKMQHQVEFLDAHTDFVMVSHDMRVFDSDSYKTLGFFNSDFKLPVGELSDLIRYGTYFCNSSKTYRRSSLPDEGIDENTTYVIDWLLHIQSARCGKIGYIDEVLGEYRRHKGGTTSFDIDKKKSVFDDQFYTLEKAREYGVSDDLIRFGYSRLYLAHALQYLQARRFEDFKINIEKSYADKIFCNRKHKICYRLKNVPQIIYLGHRFLKTIGAF